MAFFPLVKRLIRTIVSGGSEVTRDRLIYEQLDAHPAPADAVNLTARVLADESQPVPVENATALALVRADDLHPIPAEATPLTLRAMPSEIHPAAADTIALVAATSEAHPIPTDQIAAIIAALVESHPVPVEATPLTVRAIILESHPLAADSNAVAPRFFETAPVATDAGTPSATLTQYANGNVSTTGFTNPGNALGNTTATNASLSATSSGALGVTSNTTNGTMVVGFADPAISDLTISSVVVNVENAATSAGTLPLAQAWNVAFEYSLNGTTWTNINTLAAITAKGTRTLDITAAIGGDWTKINSLQVRATGSVTSGTGNGANATVQFFRAWVVVVASKTY